MASFDTGRTSNGRTETINAAAPACHRPFTRSEGGTMEGMSQPVYHEEQPLRADIDALPGPVVVEFGTNWCGYCRVAARVTEPAFAAHPEVRRVTVEDGPGRPLGRSYRVKVWPTLIFLRDGVEVTRLVRPGSQAAVDAALAAITDADVAAQRP